MADETDANPLVAELVAADAPQPTVPSIDDVSQRCVDLINTLAPDERQLVVKAIRGEFGG